MFGVRRNNTDISRMQSMGNPLNLRVRSSIINTKDLKELMLVYIDRRITVMLAQHNISIKIPEQVAFFQVWKPGLLAKGRHIQPVTGDQFPVQPLSIMTSYNLIDGVHAANNHDLCTDVARNEWGFKGMIMTDWTTTERGDSCTASGCMRAGNDLVMPGCFGDHDNMKKELAEGTLKLEDLKACIARPVSVIWKSNQYEESK